MVKEVYDPEKEDVMKINFQRFVRSMKQRNASSKEEQKIGFRYLGAVFSSSVVSLFQALKRLVSHISHQKV